MSSSATSLRSGMMRSGIVYPQPPLVRLTGEIAHGLWPTPDAGLAQVGEGIATWIARKIKHATRTDIRPTRAGLPLAIAAQMTPEQVAAARKGNVHELWPTPKAAVSGPDYARISRPRSGGDDLATAVARRPNWPTPHGMTSGTKDGQYDGHGNELSQAVLVAEGLSDSARSAKKIKRWPTPVATDAFGAGSRNTKTSKAHPGISLTDAVRGDGGTGRGGAPKRKHGATASARDWKDTPGMATASTDRDGSARSRLDQLPRQVYAAEAKEKNWQTPRGEDAECAGSHRGTPDSLYAQTKHMTGTKGQLNPRWVETLMGFPAGWTLLPKGSAPKSGRRARTKRSTTGKRPVSRPRTSTAGRG